MLAPATWNVIFVVALQLPGAGRQVSSHR